MNIDEMKRKRFNFLKEVYKRSDGDDTVFLDDVYQIGDELVFDRDLTSKIVNDLQDEGLIEVIIGGKIRIVHDGIRKVERVGDKWEYSDDNDKREDTRTTQIFISYSDKEKEKAEKIKDGLKEYGLYSFIAHDDIPLGERWREKIKEELKECDVFIPILSENYKKSEWADQEAGYVCISDKLIIPIDLGMKPYGFMKKYQAKSYNENAIGNLCSKILDRICEEIGDKAKEEFIQTFLDSRSFKDANKRSEILDKFSYSQEEVDRLIDGTNSNSQIRGATRAYPKIKKLAQKHGKEENLHDPSYLIY